MVDDTETILAPLTDKDREHVAVALAAVEYSIDPVGEAEIPGLRDPILRRCLDGLLRLRGRTLIQVDQFTWTSGYRDDVMEHLLAEGWQSLPDLDRAVLALVLIHSVAIPRAEGALTSDSWMSPVPAPMDELRRRSQVPVGQLQSSLARLRAAGLVKQAQAKNHLGSGQTVTGYVPGPQFHRLTPAARQRLQDAFILAAAPDSPLASIIRSRPRAHEGET